MKKRFLSVLLCICMVLTLTPTMAFAAEAMPIEEDPSAELQVVDAGYFAKGVDAKAYFQKILIGGGQDCGDNDPIMYVRFNKRLTQPVLMEFSVNGTKYAIYGGANTGNFHYWSLKSKSQVDFEQNGDVSGYKKRESSSPAIVDTKSATDVEITLEKVYLLGTEKTVENCLDNGKIPDDTKTVSFIDGLDRELTAALKIIDFGYGATATEAAEAAKIHNRNVNTSDWDNQTFWVTFNRPVATSENNVKLSFKVGDQEVLTNDNGVACKPAGGYHRTYANSLLNKAQVNTSNLKPGTYTLSATNGSTQIAFSGGDNSKTLELARVTIDKSNAEDGTSATAYYKVGDEINLDKELTSTNPDETFIGWYDDEGNKVGTNGKFTVNEAKDYTLKAKFEDIIKEDEIGPANIFDNSEGGLSTEQVVTGNEIKKETKDGGLTYDITVSGTDLKYHANAQGKGGYWTGFYVKAPTGAEGVKVSWKGNGNESVVTDLEEAVDGASAQGYAFFYDLSKDITSDTVKIQFFRDKKCTVNQDITPETTINVDFNVTTDSMNLTGAGFTYNKDEENAGKDSSNETMYVKFNNNYDDGKYIVTVTGPGNYTGFYCADDKIQGDDEIKTLARSYNEGGQGDGITPGTYTLNLYTYSGKTITKSDTLTISNDGKPSDNDVHSFAKLGDTKQVSISDEITSIDASGTGSETDTNAIVSANADVEDHVINITGSAANLKDDEDIDFTLNLKNTTDETAGEVTVNVSKNGTSWDNPNVTVQSASSNIIDKDGPSFNLLKQGKPFTVNVDVDVLEQQVLDAKAEVSTDPSATDAAKGVASQIKPPSIDTDSTAAVQEAAVEAAVKAPAVNKSQALAALNKNLQTVVEEDEVNIYIVPAIEVAIKDYKADASSDGEKTLMLDISAVYKVVASTDADGTDLKFKGDSGVNAEDVNAAVVETKSMNVTKPVELKVGLPNGFAANGDNVYVTHKDQYVYDATVSSENSDLYATFTTTHGFSPFVISTADSTVATVGDVKYTKFQDAVDAVTDGDDITLGPGAKAQNANLTAKAPAKEITFYVKRGNTGVSVKDNIKIADNGNYEVQTKDESEASVTYTVTQKGSSTNPGPSGGSGSSTPATVTTASTTNGSFTVSDRYASAGKTVTITPKPNDGYIVDTVTVTDKNGNSIKVTKNADGTYSFVMPEKSAQPVKVEVTFKEDDGTGDHPSAKFTDVVSGAWYQTAVDYVIANGLMEGTSDTTFEPNTTTSRGMVVTILYRLEGTPSAAASGFPDVAAGQWYTDAVSWAAANGIVTGYDNGNFGPNDIITREQMATILYRYASHKAYGTGAQANLASYTDASAISGYAESAMKWANAEGLITGTTTTTLSPAGDASRAEVATILMRFCEEVVK